MVCSITADFSPFTHINTSPTPALTELSHFHSHTGVHLDTELSLMPSPISFQLCSLTVGISLTYHSVVLPLLIWLTVDSTAQLFPFHSFRVAYTHKLSTLPRLNCLNCLDGPLSPQHAHTCLPCLASWLSPLPSFSYAPSQMSQWSPFTRPQIFLSSGSLPNDTVISQA